jgi:hypothetical protein
VTVGHRLALQTAAVRRGNGFCTARVGLATNGITSHYGAHVTCSAHVPQNRGR